MGVGTPGILALLRGSEQDLLPGHARALLDGALSDSVAAVGARHHRLRFGTRRTQPSAAQARCRVGLGRRHAAGCSSFSLIIPGLEAASRLTPDARTTPAHAVLTSVAAGRTEPFGALIGDGLSSSRAPPT